LRRGEVECPQPVLLRPMGSTEQARTEEDPTKNNNKKEAAELAA
jgi:hypothetical protein